MSADAPVIAALDTDDLDILRDWSAMLRPVVGCVKVGLQAFVAHGPAAVHAVHAVGDDPGGSGRIFLDLKLHDIPPTVAGAARAAAALGVDMLTVHAAGGADMIAAAVEAAPSVDILAVTVLTSLDGPRMAAVGQPPVAEQVLRLGRLAVDAGAAGLICAPPDVHELRTQLGTEPLLVVPGIRMHEAADDQARVGTPATAMADGADWIVVGRPITTAADPAAAARRISADALAGRQGASGLRAPSGRPAGSA